MTTREGLLEAARVCDEWARRLSAGAGYAIKIVADDLRARAAQEPETNTAAQSGAQSTAAQANRGKQASTNPAMETPAPAVPPAVGEGLPEEPPRFLYDDNRHYILEQYYDALRAYAVAEHERAERLQVLYGSALDDGLRKSKAYNEAVERADTNYQMAGVNWHKWKDAEAELAAAQKEVNSLKAQRDTAYGYGRDGGEPPWMK